MLSLQPWCNLCTAVQSAQCTALNIEFYSAMHQITQFNSALHCTALNIAFLSCLYLGGTLFALVLV